MNKKKQGILATLLALVLLLGPVLHPISAMAISDPVEQFAWDYLQCVESGFSQSSITTEAIALDTLLKEIFTRYPALYYYYGGCSSTTSGGKMVVTMNFKNQGTDIHSLYVIDSDEELMAVIGLCLGQIRDSIYFVTSNYYVPSDTAIQNALTHLQHNYHLAYMGYHGWETSYTYNDEWGIREYELGINYYYDLDAPTLQQWRNETEQVALQLASSLFAKQDMPDYLKVLRIHDWIVNNTRYNIANMDEPGNHLAYGALVKGSCVCMGYAEACTLLFQAAGIESVSVSGDGINSSGARESHAWNAVKLDGDWYMLDATWDDPVTSDGSDVLRYDYFNITSAQLSKDHVWDSDKYPQCNGTFYNISKVQELASQDNNVYSGYDPGALMTQEKALAAYQLILTNTQPELPADPEPTPVQPTPAQPVSTQPAQPTTSTERPTTVVPPADPTPTQSVPVPQPGDTSDTNDPPSAIGWIIAAVIVVLGCGAAVFLLVLKKRSQPKTSSRYDMDSGSGFSDLPKRW